MTASSLDRWLLVDYAGYPYAPNSLMPDNGLANLAGALLQRGKSVRILDYSTVSTLRRLTSPDLTRRLGGTWEAVRGAASPVRRLAALLTLHGCERTRQRLQARVVEEIAAELAEQVRRDGIQAVGFKLWNGDGFAGSVLLAERLRAAAPTLKIFAGGPHVDFFMERILERGRCFDALVYGEGEETIQLLADTGADPASWAGIPNLIYRADGRVTRTPERLVARLDELPAPAYDPEVYPAMRGDDKIKIVVIDESRGCGNECAFCIHPVKSHQQQRCKSVPRLIEEVRRLGARYGVQTFRFAGSCTPYSLLNEFAGEVIRQGLTINYASFAHVRHSEEADFAALRRSGCLALFFGLESGSQPVLDRLRKHIRVTDMGPTLRRVRAAGLFSVGSLIVPAPGETPASERETLAMLAQDKPDSVTLQAPIVSPRTPWFETPGDYGIAIPDRNRYLDEALVWKAKLLLPTSLWAPLPVRIDGQSYRTVLRRTAAFGRQLAALGIPTGISDETYVMSVKAGLDPVAFRDAAVRAFFTGNADAVGDLTQRINRRV